MPQPSGLQLGWRRVASCPACAGRFDRHVSEPGARRLSNVERSATYRDAPGDVAKGAVAPHDRGEPSGSAVCSGPAGGLTGSRFEPEAVVAALNRANVRYVIVGGLASGAHGVVRATRDLDLVPAHDAGNLEALARALTALQGRHPVQGRLTAENIGAPSSIKVETRHGEVHVLNRMPGTPPFDELEAAAMVVEVDTGQSAPICGLAHLRQMKRASDRPRDRVDLEELDELHGPE